jgi:ATP-dependent helicase HrpA
MLLVVGGLAHPTARAMSAPQSHLATDHRRAALDALRAAGRLRTPDTLPIAECRDDLLTALRDRQVVVVAGETGSGKSTQLPKLCLELGRGVNGLIGHTQPRRVAARSIAERVADELGVELGHEVGYTVRFTDRASERTLVRVMTDGILLAELQRDRLLRRYDTLIVDEAHERSLNIDFILGYLRQLLPSRPDLKVIVTSATIDTERFASHFARDGLDAPIVRISGRAYPVEVRYRPFGAQNDEDPRDDRDQVQAICDAVDELAAEGPGDVLVFCSGEREIHDTADALRRRALSNTEVLPLYARLSSVEQRRIFQPHAGRRIVVSTNVAETSLTVPGVRYVVDAGTARISRYSRQLKVQRLPIEPISQASADQRAGRCGRVAPGICIRLYSEDDYRARPEFTVPEILRTNLASVILQMTSIGLGDITAFPFLEPPDTASVRDGYRLLEELAAIEPPAPDGSRRLTRIGKRLARLPIDPRLGRMVLEAERHGCVREVMVIAAALSIQDPRERPQDARQQADEAHRRFDVAGSDLLSLVALWDYLRDRQRQLTSNQFRKLCRAEHLSYLRVREWQDLFSQLRQVAGELGIRSGTEAGHPDRVHQAVLAGLLSHIGVRDGDGREYRGPRGARFAIAPGSVLAKQRPRWVMAAELVETNRLWARRVAAIQPEWAERAGAHLVKRSYGEPRWDAQHGGAVVGETVTLFGLPLVSGRTVGLERVDPVTARAMFVRHALVEGQWRAHHGFLRRNERFVERVRAMEDRVRRTDLLDDETLVEFYDQRVPDEVVSTRHFDRWWTSAQREQPDLLDLTDEVVARRAGGIRFDDYPDTWRQGDLDLALTYRFDPGSPLDGVCVHVPLTQLNQVSSDGFDWQIPGYRRELVEALVRTLPKELRRHLIPLADTTAAAVERLGPPRGRLVDALSHALREVTGVLVPPDAFDPTRLPRHLRMGFVVVDDAGEVRDAGWDLDAIRRRLASEARAAIAAASGLAEQRGLTAWEVGTVPKEVESVSSGRRVRGYPALLDDGDSVSLRVLTNAELQQRVMRAGVRRLLTLRAGPSSAELVRALGNAGRLAVAAAGVDLGELVVDCVTAALDRVIDDWLDERRGELPWDEASFTDLARDAQRRAGGIARDALATAADVLGAATRVRAQLERLVAPSLEVSAADARAHLERLVTPGFVVAAGTRRLPEVHRYVRGIEHRLDRLAGEVARDHRRLGEVLPLERRYAALVQGWGPGTVPAEVAALRWELEELRISVFAQPLGAKGSVSPARIARALNRLGAP